MADMGFYIHLLCGFWGVKANFSRLCGECFTYQPIQGPYKGPAGRVCFGAFTSPHFVSSPEESGD